MGVSPVLLLMEDRPHPEIMFCSPEGVFNLGKLNVGIPENPRVRLGPVSAEDIASPCFHRPLIAFLVLFDIDGEPLFPGNGDNKERSGPTVSLKESPDLPQLPDAL